MKVLILTYAQWKQVFKKLGLKPYYVAGTGNYELVIVDSARGFLYTATIDSTGTGSKITDFLNNVKPVSTEKESEDACIVADILG